MLFDRYLTIRFTAADPENVITRLSCEGVELSEISWIDFLTVEIRIMNSQRLFVCAKLEGMGISFCILKRSGTLWLLDKILKRPVFLLSLLLFSLLVLFLPSRVMRIEIVGNETASAKAILQLLEDSGVSFGAKTSEIRSENIKNILMKEIPKIQWVGVTVSGCKVTICVRERSDNKIDSDDIYAVSNIVATQDGIISKIISYRGNPLVQVGESVKRGDVIISGYTDCGIMTVAQQASGEVFAYTQRKCRVLTPTTVEKRESKVAEYRCYRLQLGKKVINFCNHSGISSGTCVKMYSEYYWSLPGGFRIPVCFTQINHVEYDTVIASETAESIHWLPEHVRNYVKSQMLGGSILTESVIWNTDDGFSELHGTYACHEMIGKEKHEEIVGQDAKDY